MLLPSSLPFLSTQQYQVEKSLSVLQSLLTVRLLHPRLLTYAMSLCLTAYTVPSGTTGDRSTSPRTN